MSYFVDEEQTANTQVDLQIKPQIKTPLPEVKLKPADNKNENISEMITHLLLQKYHKISAKITEWKNKALALPFIQKGLQAKTTLTEAKNKYTDKEQQKAQLAQLKNNVSALGKNWTGQLDQKLKIGEKLQMVKGKISKQILQEKLAKFKADLTAIRQQLKDILSASLKNALHKKKS